MNEIKIDPKFEAQSGKWIVARHERVVIEKDLELSQEITCEYYEDNNGVIGEKTTNHIDTLQVPDTEKTRLKGMYKDFSFSRSTKGRYVHPTTLEPVTITDPQTGEPIPDLVYGTDYISEKDMWQGIDNIAGLNKVADNVYALIEANITKMRDNNLSIT